MRTCVFIVALLLVTAGTAAAKPKKDKGLPCSNEISCARKCSAKNGAACDRLAQHLDDDLETYRNAKEVHAHYVELHTTARKNLPGACKAKQPRACVLLGRLEEQGLGGVADASSAEARFSKACDGGEPAGCIALGNAYKLGSFGGRVDKLAYGAYMKGCSAGSQDACAKAGLMKSDGMGTERDLDGGIDMIEEACVKKSPDACATLSYLAEANLGNVGGPAEAGRYARRACEVGHATMCSNLAGKATDPVVKVELYELGCQHGYYLACSLAADLVGKDDAARAVTFDDRACRLGDAYTCSQLAELYEKGTDKIAKNRAKQLDYLDAACEAGNEYVCISRIRADLPETVTDEKTYVTTLKTKPKKGQVEKVIARLVAACDDGNGPACDAASELLSSGVYIKPDLKKARRHAQRSCELSKQTPCYQVEYIDQQIKVAADGAACKKDDLEACVRWAQQSLYGADAAAAVAALDKACKGKVEAGCAALRQHRYNSGDVAVYQEIFAACLGGSAVDCGVAIYGGDTAKARQAGEKGCDLGDGQICLSLGWMYNDIDDQAGALAAFERACKQMPGSDGCAQVEQIRAAQAVEAEKQRVAAEAERVAAQERADEAACKAGKPATCVAVGQRIEGSRAGDALAAYQRACKAKIEDGCFRAARLLASGGAGLTADPGRARDDLQGMCDGGSVAACYEVAGLYYKAGDNPRATSNAIKACAGNHPEACDDAAELIRTTSPEGRSDKNYKVVLEHGCKQGNTGLCEELRNPGSSSSGEVTSSYTPSRSSSSGPRRTRMSFDLGAFQLEPSDGGAAFEAYKGGFLGIDVRARRALGGGGLGLVGDLRGAISYDEQSDLGYDVNGALGASLAFGPMRIDLLGVLGYDAMGEPMLGAFGLTGARYVGWEGRGHVALGDTWGVGAGYAKLSRTDQPQERRFELTIDRRRERGGAIGLGLRSVQFDAGGSMIGGFLRLDR